MLQFAGLDIETPGLYPTMKGAKIIATAINYKDKISVEQNPEKVKAICENPKIVKVIHNAGFDAYWYYYLHGIKIAPIWDTMLAEQIIIGDNPFQATEEDKLKYSVALNYTLFRYGLTKKVLDKSHRDTFLGRTNIKLTPKDIEYISTDVKYLLQLQALQERRLIKLGQMMVMNLENQLVEKIVEMTDRGIGWDGKRWMEIAKQNELKFNAIEKKLPPGVNWNSPVQIKNFFFKRGVAIDSLTNIEEINNRVHDPILTNLVELRGLYKAVTAYGRKWVFSKEKGSTIDEDGRVRPSVKQILNTARLAYYNPNLHQLPEEQQTAIVPAKGKVFVKGDYNSQEIGIMAAASKEDVWIKAILRKEDVHSLTASLLYEQWTTVGEKGCTFPKKCTCPNHLKLRQNAKIINFAIAYGAGPSKIGKSLGLNDRAATRLLNKYKSVVRNLNRWLNTNADNAVKTKTSFSADPFKRRRTLRDPEEWMIRNNGKNNPVQSCGANMLKLAIVSTDLPLVMHWHDALIAEVDKKDAKKTQKELKAVMEKAADFCTGIPGLITVDPIITKSLK